MADHREVEDKYDADEQVDLPDLGGLPGVAAVAAPEEQELEARYVDTADLALARAQVTLRRRTGGSDPGWHLKLPTGDGRHEVQAPLGEAEAVPELLRDAVQVLVREQALTPVATVRNRRTARRLLDTNGAVLAEVADDRVTAWTGDPIAPRSWREWEVELVEGDRSLLTAAGRLLAASGARPSRSASKLARTLGDRLPPEGEPPALTPKTPAATVVQGVLAEQVAELVRRDPLVRCDVPDSVHKMRVATRQLRSVLATYRPLVDREVTEPLRDELKVLGELLGHARDAEVLAETFRSTFDAEVRGLEGEQARDHVLAEMHRRYERAHDRVVVALRSERYLDLVDRLLALAADPPWTDEAHGTTRQVLRRLVRNDWERLAARAEAVEDGDDPVLRAAALHEVRKAAKRLRYSAEPMVPVYGKDAGRFATRVKRIQTTLGDHHDLVVARAELRGLARRAAADGADVFPLGVLYARLEKRTVEAEEAYQKAWRRASARKLRRWLG